VRKASEDQTHNFGAFQVEIDDHFIKTFQMSLAAGRNFQFQDSSNLSGREKTRVIVNEEVVKGLGFSTNEAAINQPIVFGSGRNVDAEIIGVVKNYHQRTLKDPYDPILYYYPAHIDWKYFSLNMNTNNLNQNLASIETLYKSIFSGHPFEYFFLNEYFNRQYQADQRFGKIFALFTILCIFVACLGLLGLSTFVIRLRTKEIGIRKVLGATISSIILLFYKDFFKLLCLATVISIPIIYFMADRWLRNYAFHAHLSWLIFAMPPLLLLAISLLTISLQSGKAALANPVKSLKTE
jgi:putative ABC transport system permease protein